MSGHLCFVCGGVMRRLFPFPNGRFVVVCRACGLRRLLPVPSAEERATLYGRKEYFTEDLAALHDHLQAGYDERSEIIGLYRRHLAALKAVKAPPARLLEIGCARGVFLDMARRAGYAASGVEMNGYAAAYAKEHFGIDVAPEPFEAFAGEPGSFDAVVAFDVIEHVPDPAGFVARAAALLGPGGVMLIGTPDSFSLPARVAEAGARLTGGRWWYPSWRFYGNGIEHLSLFNRKNLETLLGDRGLEPELSYRYGIPPANMRDLRGAYRVAMGALSSFPYEIAVAARKEAGGG